MVSVIVLTFPPCASEKCRLSFRPFLVAKLSRSDRNNIVIPEDMFGNTFLIHVDAILAAPINNSRLVALSDYDSMAPADEIRFELNIIVCRSADRQPIFEQWKLQFLAVGVTDQQPDHAVRSMAELLELVG